MAGRNNTLLLRRSLHALCAPGGLHTSPRALWAPRHKTISDPTTCELLLQCCMRLWPALHRPPFGRPEGANRATILFGGNQTTSSSSNRTNKTVQSVPNNAALI